MSFNPEYFNELAKARRSVFPDQFDTTREVPAEIIRQVVENATWAPNHGQTEPWEFTIISGEGLKKLASFQSELYKKEAGADFNDGKYIKLQNQPLRASHIISIGMKRTTTKRIPEIEDIEAGLQIAPLLLVVLIENAFKFVSNFPDKENKIMIKIFTKEKVLFSSFINTKEGLQNALNTNSSGIGLANLKRRLELLYANKYELIVNSDNDLYETNLIITLA